MNARSPSPLRASQEPLPSSLQLKLQLQPMTTPSLGAVMAIENQVYPFPWSHGNFVDSVAAGHQAWLLEDLSGLVGYYVAMPGFEEMHLLNITVAPAHQRQGHARRLLTDLVARCATRHARQLWLEVRVSNVGAREAYRRLGFSEVSVRRGYYPAARGTREDAIVMSLPIGPLATTTGDSIALD